MHRRPYGREEDVTALIEAATTGGDEQVEAGVDILMTAEWGEKFDTLLPDELTGRGRGSCGSYGSYGVLRYWSTTFSAFVNPVVSLHLR